MILAGNVAVIAAGAGLGAALNPRTPLIGAAHHASRSGRDAR